MRVSSSGEPAVGPTRETCHKCGAVTNAGGKFCQSCGVPLVTPCPACGAAVGFGAAYCTECGVDLRSAADGLTLGLTRAWQEQFRAMNWWLPPNQKRNYKDALLGRWNPNLPSSRWRFALLPDMEQLTPDSDERAESRGRLMNTLFEQNGIPTDVETEPWIFCRPLDALPNGIADFSIRDGSLPSVGWFTYIFATRCRIGAVDLVRNWVRSWMYRDIRGAEVNRNGQCVFETVDGQIIEMRLRPQGTNLFTWAVAFGLLGTGDSTGETYRRALADQSIQAGRQAKVEFMGVVEEFFRQVVMVGT